MEIFALFVLLLFTWYTELTCPRRDVIYLEKKNKSTIIQDTD